MVVFNADNLVKSGHDLYSVGRRRIIGRMEDMGTKVWADRAKRFDRFQPQRHSTRPTEWYVLWAGSLLLMRDLRRMIWPGLPRLLAWTFHDRAESGSDVSEEWADDEAH